MLKKEQDEYISYILEDFTKEKKIFAIDPTIIGNIGRCINHSCDPNLSKHLVRVDTTLDSEINIGVRLLFF